MWQIAVKPGKPLAFGEVEQAFFVGLPGNPVSSFVTFLMFVRPFILRLQGVQHDRTARLHHARRFRLAQGRRRNEFLRVR
jgi:molybdopterin molybdotransferase